MRHQFTRSVQKDDERQDARDSLMLLEYFLELDMDGRRQVIELAAKLMRLSERAPTR